ncbi:hypothetical protein AMATHDRAFT_138781 [Amanita thiersii Skay4041]|uniref:PH domain-containing protein n=1 Tax=Amanita thiersii Skay4041 TaxID=703135 RepID=A0A2A9NX14_9AGAR|nr:hypothetical protein AMATHDRAFT_138781 [Amanita thiersii Skay4041]
MSPSAAPPSPQEIQRKLSVHSVSRSIKKPPTSSTGIVSGTESDSDSILANEFPSAIYPASSFGNSPSQTPLSAIAERRSGSGEDTEEEDEEEGGWKTAKMKGRTPDSVEEGVLKSGYLWKKGQRRKTWKKRWFVLRPHHLAYYKNSAEYQLHRLLELSDVHSCIQVTLKRHEHTFGLISPVRTFYLQANSDNEVQAWVKAIEDARKALMATSTQSSGSAPEPPPSKREEALPALSTSPPSHPPPITVVSSSDSEDALPECQQTITPSPQRLTFAATPSKVQTPTNVPSKVILSGYLMKCGSKRRNWRKRWFVLTSDKLFYTGSHMDTRPHRQFPFANILDALEFDRPPARQNLAAPYVTSPPTFSASSSPDESHVHTFKIVTTKRTLLLCAPTEEDELKWLGAVRTLIARRSGTGQLPGDIPKESGKIQGAESSSGGFKGKMRRLSTSGSAAVGPLEHVQDKTS